LSPEGLRTFPVKTSKAASGAAGSGLPLTFTATKRTLVSGGPCLALALEVTA
jgi:hypothetical protein